MNPYRENKFHTWIIKVTLIYLAVIIIVEAFFKKHNPGIIRFSENSISYYLLIFGFCSACYALSMLLIYIVGISDFTPKENREAKFWEKVCFYIGAMLWIVGLPASIFFGGLRRLYDIRLIDGIERENNKKWQEKYDYAPCPHCGQSRKKKDPEFWEPLD